MDVQADGCSERAAGRTRGRDAQSGPSQALGATAMESSQQRGFSSSLKAGPLDEAHRAVTLQGCTCTALCGPLSLTPALAIVQVLPLCSAFKVSP